jgi:hypothetical protein
MQSYVTRIGLLLALLAGCTKLDTESMFDVPLEGKIFTVDSIKSQQTVKAEGTATGGPVNVYLYLDKNKAAAQKDILAKKLVSPFIMSKVEGAETFSVEATIPANETAVVEVTRAGKPAKVKLHITNKS